MSESRVDTFKCPSGNRTVLYLQFTDPAGLPPLEYSARILREGGWAVRFLGVSWPAHPRMFLGAGLDQYVKLLAAPVPGWRQKVFYLRYTFFALIIALRVCPNWIYVSDSRAAPAGCLLKMFGFRVIYHEHDSPGTQAGSWLTRTIALFRRMLARNADANILPQEERIRFFREDTGTRQPIHCVWNCPMVDDVVKASRAVRNSKEPLGVYFHGSLNLNMVSPALIEGAKRSGVPVLLRVVGYETVGSAGTCERLRELAREAGPLVTLELPGAFSRHELAAQMDSMHVGWMAYCCSTQNFNLVHLAGASNKAFDYLAAGLPLLVRDTPDWRELFAVPGFARYCDPNDPDSIAAALRWFYENPTETSAMGDRGRAKISKDWNYEARFRATLQLMGSL
jgi:glycosyltransferase involved in cell wall biosynthesis